jgi:HSP20 family molecular chaperone IbpA
MSLFYRNIADFSPFFRLADDLEKTMAVHSQSSGRSFAPRFDMKETKEAYELQGELPGIERPNINIEWNEANALVVSGHTEHSYEYETPEGQDDKKPTAAKETDNFGSGGSAQLTKASDKKELAKWEKTGNRYWITERSTGSFYRTFQFPTNVDREGVKAVLKDGILTITVPKTKTKEPQKVIVE